MSHHAGTWMATVVFNIHWDESSCMPVIKIHSAQHPHARCLYHIHLEETHSFDIYLSQMMKQSMGAKRGCCFVIDGLVMNTGRGARRARKWGRVRVTEGDLPPLFAPLFSPFAPAAKSTVHIQCHLGFPHPPLPYPMAHMSRFFAFTRLFRSVGVHSPSIFQPPPI